MACTRPGLGLKEDPAEPPRLTFLVLIISRGFRSLESGALSDRHSVVQKVTKEESGEQRSKE